MTSRTLAAVSLLVMADAWHAVRAQQPPGTGRIEGIATISRRLTTARPRVRIYSEPGTPLPAAAAEENRFANVVLYLDSVAPTASPAGVATPEPAMRQLGERFEPHVLPVLVGTTVSFPNDDPIYHNVFSLSRARSFDLGRYPRGSSKAVRFTSPGVVQVFCHIHADMSGYILVLENPFFVVPNADGAFVLDGVPPGDYRLIAWNERIRPVITPVHVEAGRATELRVAIPLPEVPGTP